MTTIITGTTLTSGYQLTADSTGTLAIQTGSGPTTALYIDASQNVGIGTSSPAVKLEVKASSGAGEIRVDSSAGDILQLQSSATESRIGSISAVPLTFRTSNVEAMRIDSSGNLLLNSVGNTTFTGASSNPKQFTSAGALGTSLNNTVDFLALYNSNSNASYLRFYQYRNTAGTDWTTSSTRIQQIIDVTSQAYIEFNPINANYGLAFGGGNPVAERMRIDSSGRITNTSQPYAYARCTATQAAYTITAAQTHIVQYNSTLVNTGSAWNTSTYRFTCPVAGKYFVYAHIQINGLTATSWGFNFGVYKNAAIQDGAYEAVPGGDSYRKPTITAIVSAAANDFIDIRMIANVTSGTIEYTAPDQRFACHIYLLG